METDIVHEFGKDPEWSESFYFSFYDRQKDINGVMRIGLMPNLKEKDWLCFFFMPDGAVVGIRESIPFDNAELRAKGLRFEKVVPDRTWRLRFSGKLPRGSTRGAAKQTQVELDLEFRGLHEVFDYRRCVTPETEAIARSVASEHVEQFGRLKGRLGMGLEDYEIDALGERDHSWGVRRWTTPRMWIWLTCQLSEDYAFNLTKLATDGAEIDAGFVFRDGMNVPLRRADIKTSFDFEGGPKAFDLTLYDAEGEVTKAGGSVQRGTKLEFHSVDRKVTSIMHETLTKYTIGGKIGYGIAEYLSRRR